MPFYCCFFLALILSFILHINSKSLEWGTYRPGVYFGIRAKHPRSPLFGFLWYDAGKYEGIQSIRHECSDNDHLSTYGWIMHNGKDFGQQIFFDPLTKLHLTTSWLQFPYKGSDQNGWLAIIDGREMVHAPNIASGVIGTIWYVIDGEHGLQFRNSSIFAKKRKYQKGRVIQIEGEIVTDTDEVFDMECNADDQCSASVLKYSIIQILDEDNKYGPVIRSTRKKKLKSVIMEERTYISGLHMSDENKWKIKDVFLQLMESQARKLYRQTRPAVEKKFPDDVEQQRNIFSQFSPNLKHGKVGSAHEQSLSNVLLMQNFLLTPFLTYVIFLPSQEIPDIQSLADLPEFMNSKSKILNLVTERMKRFSFQFSATFNLKVRQQSNDSNDVQNEFDPVTGHRLVSRNLMQLARYSLSNMIGGIGYWFGSQIWQLPNNENEFTPDMQLLSAVPSRSFFPRGFLWDEGFHQLLIGIWDMDLSLEIIQSWLNNMNEDGWIAREQILGDEARSRVPAEFQIQKPNIANPPTMFLAIEALVNRYFVNADDKQLYRATCFHLFVNDTDTEMEAKQLKCHSIVQENKMKILSFLQLNWQRLQLHFNWYLNTQTSPVHKNSFRWAGREKNHNLPSGLDDYPRFVNVTVMEGHVDMHCWIIKLYDVMSKFARHLNEEILADEWQERTQELILSLDEYHWDIEHNAYLDYVLLENNSKVFVVHIGYVSSFPLLLHILPSNSPHLRYILDQISDPNGMWSDFGLRSLAKNDDMYGTNEDYWRGAIWMNMNYLAVKSLYNYNQEMINDENKEYVHRLYTDLRANIIRNLFVEYRKFGYLYENYNGDNGSGQRSKPFTGWSSLITNIIAELYP